MHFDTYLGQDSRRITAIVYLNPDWRPGHGGELRLLPFPRAPVTIQPLANRMVRRHLQMVHSFRDARV